MPNAMPLVQQLANLFTSSRYKVEGDSMLPTLAGGQYVLSASQRSPWNSLRRGDIVVLRHPAGGDMVYIKRIVGLPDEEVQLVAGRVHLNGTLLEEAYPTVPFLAKDEASREWWTGPNEYFVLGDNRRSSQDSRTFGPVTRELILGRVWFRYWPPWAWGTVPSAPRRRQ